MKPTIALFLHQPKCSIQSGNGILEALSLYYNFKIFTKHDLENDFFDNVDIVAIPGGIGDSDSYEYLMRINAGRIRKFVNQGGKYLGICMGAYWAGSQYFNILENVDAVQYITRPDTDTRRPHAKAIDIKWNQTPHKMFFYDGCALVGGLWTDLICHQLNMFLVSKCSQLVCEIETNVGHILCPIGIQV